MFQRLELTSFILDEFYIVGVVSKINRNFFLLTNIKRDNIIENLIDHNWFKKNKNDVFFLNQQIRILVRVSRYKKGYKLVRL